VNNEEAFQQVTKTKYPSLIVSYKQVSSRCFSSENFCKLTSERKTGTPVFQKTGAKKIKNL
jgi:hypothetical protein